MEECVSFGGIADGRRDGILHFPITPSSFHSHPASGFRRRPHITEPRSCSYLRGPFGSYPMSRGRACSVVGLLLLLQCNGLSLHNCGGHNESNAGQARQNIKRKASSGSALSATMGRYPGSSSNVAGVVSVTVSGGFLQVSYTLTGLNAQLESGGLHIHSGSGTDVCTDASLPGSHYHAMGVTDPWTTYWTKTAGSTTATGSFSVGTTGFDTLAENELHAVVVHGAGRFRPYARVGCGVLQYIGGAASSAVGDPHLQNVHGERFDLMKPGKHLLIQIPRKSSENTLLRVEAEARQLGGLCADMYFQDLNPIALPRMSATALVEAA